MTTVSICAPTDKHTSKIAATARSLYATLLACICCLSSFGAELAAQDADLSGTWITDQGVMEMTVSGKSVEGTYGESGTVSGKVTKGNKLELKYKNGNSVGSLNLEVDKSGTAFDGKWQSRGGSGTWRGWKKDESAEDGEAADFSGYWMTAWGPMQIQQQGDQVSGTFAAHGWSSFEGTVKGRRMTFNWKKLRFKGQAWVEQSSDGKLLYGATVTDNPSPLTGIRVPDHEHHVAPKAGEIVKGYADNGMMYHLRMPNDWKEGDDVDVIVLLHGSNWTTAGMVYITNENWPELGKKFAILGIQGEQWVKYSDAESPRFNYTYQNWMGRSTYKGYPYTDRESPYLVMKVLDELGQLHSFSRTFIGGHSQGGYLTYALHMHFPEKISGTFPIAGGLIMQAEPDVFDDEDLMAAQRATPMAIVHGKRDSVVGFSAGQYNYDRFASHGFPQTKFITPNAGHGYDFLPINEAIEYLDMLTTKDMSALVTYGNKLVKEQHWRDVGNAIAHAIENEAGESFSPIIEAYEKQASKDAARLYRAISADQDGDWVDGYLKWAEKFGRSKAGQKTVAAYQVLQSKHDESAKELLAEARKLFQSRNRKGGFAKYQEIVDEYYAAKCYARIKRALENR